MTVAMLMHNTFKAAERQWNEVRDRKLKPLKLNILEKVPSDIEIAQAQTPKPITQLAHEIGVLPQELESYGAYKAKVDLSVLDRLSYRKDGKYILVSGCVHFRLKYLTPQSDFLAESPQHLWERANPRRPSVLLRLSVPTWVVSLSQTSVNPAKDQRSVSRVVQLVVGTVKLFLWMRYSGIYFLSCIHTNCRLSSTFISLAISTPLPLQTTCWVGPQTFNLTRVV